MVMPVMVGPVGRGSHPPLASRLGGLRASSVGRGDDDAFPPPTTSDGAHRPAQRQITVALAVIEHVNAQLGPLDQDLKAFARSQSGCRALMRHYGIGPQMACAILAAATRGASLPRAKPCTPTISSSRNASAPTALCCRSRKLLRRAHHHPAQLVKSREVV